MGQEIERKFLLRDQSWKRGAHGVPYQQGYLGLDPARTLRVRVAGEKGFLTIKGAADGASRAEFEYPIPVSEARELLATLCLKPQIEKIRYRIEYVGMVWEIDEFLGDNAGLVLAEVELESPDQTIDLPPWIGAEVTGDHRYYNSWLSQNPYRFWAEA
jgi:adenylate cyclase